MKKYKLINLKTMVFKIIGLSTKEKESIKKDFGIPFFELQKNNAYLIYSYSEKRVIDKFFVYDFGVDNTHYLSSLCETVTIVLRKANYYYNYSIIKNKHSGVINYVKSQNGYNYVIFENIKELEQFKKTLLWESTN